MSRQIYDSNIVRLLCVTTESIEITSHFLDALIWQQSEGLASKVDVVYQVHNILEAMAEVAEMPACTCIAHLWIYDNQLLMHDVCDSIDLWLVNCKSDILQDRLLIIALSRMTRALCDILSSWHVRHLRAVPAWL